MNHTLVIPTYNRPEHLERLVRYYRKRASSMRLLELDSSLLAVAEGNARMITGSGMSARPVISTSDCRICGPRIAISRPAVWILWMD